jgi:pSer/pThr/pTyr-binding forkhead associated (FHA) protein
MWKLTIEDDQTNKTVVHLVREDYGLGRGEDNAIRLTERNISRRHARMERSSERWALSDLSSYNGSYVNGQRVAGTQELAHGDLIQVGDYRLLLEDETLLAGAQDATATVPVLHSTSTGPGVDRLVMLVGPTPGAEILLSSGRMLIGRGEDCDIALNHASVSRVHAELQSVGDGRYEIIDRGSANGVRVNGVELPRSFVDARDVVELGDVILKFIPAGETYLPAADESLQIAAIGASRRQEAEEGVINGLRSSPLLKVGLGVGVALLVGLLLFVALGRRAEPAELVSVKDEATAQAERALAAAQRLLGAGDVRGAYEKAAEIPAGAEVRGGGEFRAIQGAYADLLFEEAEKATDPADKRSLYDQIARSPTIDGARRSRAAERLAALSAQAVNVADLPNTPRVTVVPSAAAEPSPRPLDAAAPAARPPVVQQPATPRPAVPPRIPSAAQPVPPTSTKTGSTLVRETPF